MRGEGSKEKVQRGVKKRLKGRMRWAVPIGHCHWGVIIVLEVHLS